MFNNVKNRRPGELQASLYPGSLLLEHATLSGCSSATEVTGTLSAWSLTLLTWVSTLKQSQECYKQQSLKFNFCNASGSLIFISNALRWQVKRWLFPCLSLTQAGLWCCHLARIMEQNKHHQKGIHPPCPTHLFQDDRTCLQRYLFLSRLQRTVWLAQSF